MPVEGCKVTIEGDPNVLCAIREVLEKTLKTTVKSSNDLRTAHFKIEADKVGVFRERVSPYLEQHNII